MKRKNITFFRLNAIVLFFSLLFTGSINAQTYNFTTAGVTGREGPTQAQLDSAYTGTNLSNNVISLNGIQEWTVPTTGLYEITAAGGGFNSLSNQKGAVVSGLFQLDSGNVLRIVAGQLGDNERCGDGGSYVTRVVPSGDAMFDNIEVEPLLIAGGSGGIVNTTDPTDVSPNDINIGGRASTQGTGMGGGAKGSCFGESGAGYLGNGDGCDGDRSEAFINGAQGARSTDNNIGGGFGGGGTGRLATDYRFGGGGGYTGGDAGGNSASDFGEGGYSFNAGLNPTGTDAGHIGNGFVTLELLPPMSCPFPSNLEAQNVAATSADLAWQENGSATTWDVEWGSQGFTRGSGNLTSATTNNPLAVSGLTELNDYDFYVRSICGSGDTSMWIGPYTFSTPCANILSGAYTIDGSQATSGTNYNNFTDFVNDLTACGVSGPVTVNVAPGSYNEQIVFEPYFGMSSSNPVTIIGDDPSTTEIIFEQNVSANRYTVRFDAVSYINFEDISIVAEDAGTYGWAVHVFDNSTDLTFDNVHFKTQVTSSTFFLGMVISGSETGYTTAADGIRNIEIRNSHFEGGWAGFRMNGSSSGKIENVHVTNSVFERNDRNGAYFSQIDSITFVDNAIDIEPTGSDFGAGVWLNQVSGYNIERNSITNAGAYGIYATNSGGSAAERALIANNSISKLRRSGSTFNGGMRISNGSSEYIDIIHNSVEVTEADQRALNVSNASPSNLRIWNNSFVYAGTTDGYAMYITDVSSIEAINFNNYFSTGNDFVYYGTDLPDLSAVQAVNNPAGNDTGSVAVDPLYASSDLLIPASPGLSGAAFYLPQVPDDITGAVRDTANPDIGAYEFVPVTDDIALLDGKVEGLCKSANDSLFFTITNLLGDTVDFSADQLTINWDITGPVNSSGVITVNSGTLAEGDTMMVADIGADLSQVGVYSLNAFIDTNAINQSSFNDTIATFTHEVFERLAVTPKIDTITNPGDSVFLSAESPFFPGGDFFFTEICHWRTASTGAPSTWPAWLPSVDYVEVTGVPNSDLEGITLEQWTGSALDDSYTFPSGTVVGPNGTAIIRIGSGSAGSDPTNFYYDGVGGSASFSSTTASGKVLKDANGNVIDAVGYPGSSTYSFPAASGVTTADWSGNVPAAGSTAGIRLEGAYTKDATNWIVSSAASPQDPNILNNNVNAPSPTSVPGFSWNLDNTLVDTMPETAVGNWPQNGLYEYVALYDSTPCGSIRDTSFIYVNYLRPELVSAQDVSCNGFNDGSITITVAGGEGPYTYEWSDDPARSVPAAVNLTAGEYVVSVFDANMAVDSIVVTINEPDSLFADNVEVNNISCNGDNDGSIRLSIEGGTKPYNYSWSNGGGAANLTGLAPGSYAGTVTDANGCTLVSDSIEIVEPDAITSEVVSTTNITCNGDDDGEAELSANGGTPPYSFDWSNGLSGDVQTELEAGTYLITVSDSNNCHTLQSVTIQEPSLLQANVTERTRPACFKGNDGSASVIVSGGVSPYSFEWANGVTTSENDSLFGGENHVTVTDSNGCEVELQFNLAENDPIDTGIINQSPRLIANAEGDNVIYRWWNCDEGEFVEGAENRIFDAPANGNYALVINIDGCQDTSACVEILNTSAGDLIGGESLFEVYPNPNNGLFNVRLTGNGTADVQMEIVDMQGKVLTAKTLGRIEGELVEEVNMNLAAGVYFVKVIRDDKLSVKRVVIQ